jgi:hypothetical protein
MWPSFSPAGALTSSCDTAAVREEDEPGTWSSRLPLSWSSCLLSCGAAAAVHPHPGGMDEQVRWS